MSKISLKSYLNQLTNQELRAIAIFHRLEIEETVNRDELQNRLIDYLSQLKIIESIINDLTNKEKEILYQLHASNGDIDAGILRGLWGTDDTQFSSRWFWGQSLLPGIAHLRLMGLIFLISNNDTGNHSRYVMLPYAKDVISDRLSMFVSDIFHSDPPYDYMDWGNRLLNHLYRMIKYFTEYKVRPLKNHGLPRRHHKIIVELIQKDYQHFQSLRDKYYVDFIYELIFQSGMIYLKTDRLTPSNLFEKWASKSTGDQLKFLFNQWFKSNQDDLSRLEDIKVLSSGLRNPAQIIRKSLLNQIKNLEPGKWFKFEDLIRAFERSRPHFYRPRAQNQHWKIVFPNLSGYPEASSLWTDIEGRIITNMISGPIFWFGAAVLGTSQNWDITSFMPLQRFRQLLNDDKIDTFYQPVSDLTTITLQPDFEIILPANAPVSLRYKIEQFSELISEGPVDRYKITRSSFNNALINGITLQTIFSFLRKYSATKIPQNVKASLEYWSDQYGRIELRHECILSSSDTFLFNELKSQPRFSELFSETLGEKNAVVKKEKLAELIAQLHKTNYLPKINDELIYDDKPATILLPLNPKTANSLHGLLRRCMERDGNLSELTTLLTKLEELIRKENLEDD